MKNTKKGELIPQTVENLQAIMAKDAFMMELLDKDISKLKSEVNNLRQKNVKNLARIAGFKMQRIETRMALANYIASEGCGCCEDSDKHKAAEKRLAELLDVPMFEDKSGYDFYKFKT
jgi:acetyl-CoA carboxylase alpha subunit